MAYRSRKSGWLWLLVAALIALPALVLRLGLVTLPVVPATAVFGLGIVGAAFLLTWATEAAERDISGALALVLLALVAVLPEYAVDMSFAWRAGQQPAYAAYAAANMTGGNRLLVGVGWPLVVFFFWLKSKDSLLMLAKHHAVELSFLGLATLYSFTIPLKGSLSPWDSVVLIGLFLAYVWFAAHGPSEEVALIGPAEQIGALPTAQRRLVLVIIFLYAALIIGVAADAFANGLIETGSQLGVDRFLLVQWIAPIASEAPELIAASLLTLRGRAGSGIGAVISSTVNQWTLLLGGLPLAYSLAHGSPAALPLDSRQVEELVLTAAQSIFAVATLLSLSLSLKEAAALLVLFLAQFVFESAAVRYGFSALYLLLTLAILWRQRRDARDLLRWWRTGRPSASEKIDGRHQDSLRR